MSQVPPHIPDDLAARLLDHVSFVVRVYCRLFPDHDQKDLVQDAMIAFVERAKERASVDEPFTWLTAVVRNLHRERCRARSRDKAQVSLSRPDAAGDGETEPFQIACRSDPWAELIKLLAEVTPPFSEQEKAELLAIAAGQTRREIAVELGAKPVVVDARIKKNLERVRFFVERGKCSSGE